MDFGGGLLEFITESNLIEGIHREPTPDEMRAAERFMQLFSVSATALGDFQAVFAPGKPLREREGLNVRVGRYVVPPGGPQIVRRLQDICRRANRGEDPWKVHVQFETLQPIPRRQRTHWTDALGVADARPRKAAVRALVPASVLLPDPRKCAGQTEGAPMISDDGGEAVHTESKP